jgi:hypothetical protein
VDTREMKEEPSMGRGGRIKDFSNRTSMETPDCLRCVPGERFQRYIDHPSPD